MIIQLKPNVFIQGFNRSTIFERINNIDEVIYVGKTNEITEELAKECVSIYNNGKFYNYTKYFNGLEETINIYINTAKESIKSAVTEPNGIIYEYCIIWKYN